MTRAAVFDFFGTPVFSGQEGCRKPGPRLYATVATPAAAGR
jgi:FMN phosphatase YigB (HAD superfamily)